MSPRAYTGLKVGCLAGLMGLVLLLSWTWVRQPQTGDLARIGGYVESAYESTDPAARMAFERPLFRSLEDGHSAEPMDVLVLGDSFSYTGGRYNWVSQFAARTGLRVRVASIHRWWETWRALNESGALPPLVIVQSVERDAVDHLANINHRLRATTLSHHGQHPLLPALPMPGPLRNLSRAPLPAKSFGGFDDRISVTVDVLWKTLRRQAGLPREEVVTFAPDPALPKAFSARDQRRFVTIPADIRSQKPAPWRMKQALAGVERLHSALAAAGSHLALLVIPNRLSVYAPGLVDSPIDEPLARRLAGETGSFDAAGALQTHVQAGARDVFWAMDTHLSAVGAGLLADGFVHWLQVAGILAGADHR